MDKPFTIVCKARQLRIMCAIWLKMEWADYEAKYPVLTGIPRV